MQHKWKFRKSFVRRRILEFVGYMILMFLVFLGLQKYVEKKSIESFPAVYDLLDYESALLADNYSSIPLIWQKQCGLIVYDEKGGCVYSTNVKYQEQNLYEKRYFIPVLYGEYYYYICRVDDPVENGYLLQRIILDEDGKEILDGYCILDPEGYVLDGTIWTDHGHFSQEELALFEGHYGDDQEISQYAFVNDQGQKRLLFFIAPQFSVNKYADRYNHYQRYMLLTVPIGILILLLYAWGMKRRMNQSIMPFQQAMERLGRGEKPELDNRYIVKEYDGVARNFIEMAERLEQTEQEREEAYKNNQRIITNLAHDLKTPMTVIQGYAKALLEHEITPEKREEYLKAIYAKSSLCNDQAVTLFEYARFQHPEFHMEKQPLDFAELCSEYLADKYMEIENRGGALDAEIPEEPVQILGNPAILYRLMNNLVDNSLKYNPNGVTIYVRLTVVQGEAELLLEDDGVGIGEEVQAHLFDPFVVGNEARTSGNGNGLGLVIAKQAAELHEGSIALLEDPQTPIVTAFLIRIPLAKKE